MARSPAAPSKPSPGELFGRVPCVALGPSLDNIRQCLSLGSVLWRKGAEPWLTVVAKASFRIVFTPRVHLVPAEVAEPLVHSDRNFQDSPFASVRTPSDLVPHRPCVDVTLVGYAQPARPSPVAKVRLAILRRNKTLIDKTLCVLGDRRNIHDAPAPFGRMFLGYERSFGGLYTDKNPIGQGDKSSTGLANLVDPLDAEKVMNFGPISENWACRDLPPAVLNKHVSLDEALRLPADQDMSCFQHAPADQQIDSIQYGDRLILEGVFQEAARVKLTMPWLEVTGAVFGLSASEPDTATDLRFRADSVHIDTERSLLTLTWRSHLAISDAGVATRILIVAGAGVPGDPPLVPKRRPAVGVEEAVPALYASGIRQVAKRSSSNDRISHTIAREQYANAQARQKPRTISGTKTVGPRAEPRDATARRGGSTLDAWPPTRTKPGQSETPASDSSWSLEEKLAEAAKAQDANKPLGER